MSKETQNKKVLTVDEMIERLTIISQSGRGAELIFINNGNDKFNPELVAVNDIFVNCNDTVMINTKNMQ